MEDTDSITDLIKQVIKINNQIFQRERVNKGNSKPILYIEHHNSIKTIVQYKANGP